MSNLFTGPEPRTAESVRASIAEKIAEHGVDLEDRTDLLNRQLHNGDSTSQSLVTDYIEMARDVPSRIEIALELLTNFQQNYQPVDPLEAEKYDYSINLLMGLFTSLREGDAAFSQWARENMRDAVLHRDWVREILDFEEMPDAMSFFFYQEFSSAQKLGDTVTKFVTRFCPCIKEKLESLDFNATIIQTIAEELRLGTQALLDVGPGDMFWEAQMVLEYEIPPTVFINVDFSVGAQQLAIERMVATGKIGRVITAEPGDITEEFIEGLKLETASSGKHTLVLSRAYAQDFLTQSSAGFDHFISVRMWHHIPEVARTQIQNLLFAEGRVRTYWEQDLVYQEGQVDPGILKVIKLFRDPVFAADFFGSWVRMPAREEVAQRLQNLKNRGLRASEIPNGQNYFLRADVIEVEN